MRGELVISEIFQIYSGQGYMLILFMILLGYFAVKILKTPKLNRNKDEALLTVFGAVFTIIFLNPAFAYWIITSFPDVQEVYYRFYWCLPIPIIVAVAFTQIILYCKTKLLRAIAIVCVIATLLFCGTPFYKNERFFVAENSYKIPTNIIKVVNIIHENSKKEEPVAIFPTEYLNDVRQYDPSINLVYGRAMMFWNDTIGSEEYKNASRLIYRAMNNEEGILEEELISAIKFTEADYIVLPPGNRYATIIQDADFEFVANSHEYLIYKIKSS